MLHIVILKIFKGNQRRGRGQGRGRQNYTGRSKDVLDFEGEYDFEQANAEFQELEGKLAKIKIADNEETPSKLASSVKSFKLY